MNMILSLSLIALLTSCEGNKRIVMPCGLTAYYEYEITPQGQVVNRTCATTGHRLIEQNCALDHVEMLGHCREVIRLKTGE